LLLRCIYIPLLFFIIATKISFSQRLNLTYFSEKQGLPIAQISCVHEDKYGFIWTGTMGSGLARYKGEKFETFNINNGLPFGDIITLNSSPKDSALWIGTNGSGIIKYHKGKFSLINKGLNGKLIYSIYFTQNNQVLIGTKDDGLYYGTENNYKKINHFNSHSIYAISELNNNLYIATSKGAYVCDLNFSNVKKIELPIKGPLFSIFIDKQKTIWFGSSNGEIINLNKDIITLITHPDINETIIGGFTQDRSGTIWAVCDAGLLKIQNLKLKILNSENGILDPTLYCITSDRDDHIWIGSDLKGLAEFSNNGIVSFYRDDYLTDNTASSSLYVNQNKIWLGNNTDGILEINNNEELNSIKQILSKERIIQICKLNDLLLVTTENSELITIEGEKISRIKLVDGENNYIISQISSASTSKLIGVSYGHGICEIDLKYKTCKSISIDNIDNSLMSIEKLNNTYYLASYQMGLFKWNGNSSKASEISFNQKQSIKSIFCLANSNNCILAGTLDLGIFIIKDDKIISNISIKNGLPSNEIKSIKAIGKNKIVVGTSKGISLLNFENNIFKVVKNYGSMDGIDIENLLPDILYCDEQKNKVYVGLKHGFQQIDITKEYNPDLPLFSISKIHINNQDSSIIEKDIFFFEKNSSIILPYSKNNLKITFEAHSPLEKLEYTFLLDNFDENWTDWSTSGEFINNNIPPGEYILKAKSRIINSEIESKTQYIKILISPPFYRTWWFISLCLIFGAISIYLFIQYRTQKLIKEKEILEAKVEERTHELKESNLKLEHAYTDIKDSINYAEKIQRAILPMDDLIKKYLPDSFVLFQPRDIVSGDFYWFGTINVDEDYEKDYILFATADCTGHGVPGAFMSMVGNTILNEIVLTNKVFNPGEILHQLHLGVKKALKQNENQSRDGMDIALCCIDIRNNKLLYAGANRPLWLIDANGLTEMKATKSAIGGFTDDSTVFQEHEITLTPDMQFYTFSDGYPDQFGGPEGKKFMTKRLKDLIVAKKDISFKEKKEFFTTTINEWMGKEHEQIDDILLVGFKV
jgi:ligand-binding sensor domain-containing protein/serine phosphatase RsbU (regulator of sigma subunit)